MLHYVYVNVCVCMYIYIYIEREREWERVYIYVCIYVYIYTHIHTYNCWLVVFCLEMVSRRMGKGLRSALGSWIRRFETRNDKGHLIVRIITTKLHSLSRLHAAAIIIIVIIIIILTTITYYYHHDIAAPQAPEAPAPPPRAGGPWRWRLLAGTLGGVPCRTFAKPWWNML